MPDSSFEKLFGLNVNDHTEKRSNGRKELTYLSWSWAWAEFKKVCPDAEYEIKVNPETLQHYWYDEKFGIEVRTSVTVGNETYEMWLPVMDGANNAMKAVPYEVETYSGKKHVKAATMMDINKAIMRCLTKNLAMFGLGLYIYSGEDLPENEADEQDKKPRKKAAKEVKKASEAQIKYIQKLYSEADIKGMIERINLKNHESQSDSPDIESINDLPMEIASKMIQGATVR